MMTTKSKKKQENIYYSVHEKNFDSKKARLQGHKSLNKCGFT